MNLQVEHDNHRCTLRLQGDFTIYAALEFRDALLKALPAAAALDIDLSETGEIDAAGIQLLLLAAGETAAGGKPLRLLSSSLAVRETLALCNLGARLQLADTGVVTAS